MSEKTEYQELKEEYDRLQERYRKAREAAIGLQRRIAAVESAKPMLVARKYGRMRGSGDPFEQLRPQTGTSPEGILANIDSVSYRKGDVVVRGWVHDQSGEETPILLRDRSRILEPSSLIRYPRSDVNDLLKIQPDTCTGFTVKVPVSLFRHEDLSVEFMNEFGYYAMHVHVITDEKERRNYIDQNAHPVYAIDSGGYNDWLHDHLATSEELEAQRKTKFDRSCKISIVIPLYNTPVKFLDELLDSILAQTYGNFEVCLADGSTGDAAENRIREKYASDPRILYQRLSENKGISENTNAAVGMAHGEFIMLCDHDDTIEPDALYEIVSALNKDPEIDALYTDEDKIMLTEGVYYSPNFKPDFNPDLLRSNNYITHIFCVRKTILDEVGGERSEFDGAQDYDLILRCCEKARKICHIPRFLYHWRSHDSSTSGNPESKMYAYDNGRKAIQAHYDRVGIPAEASLAEDIGSYRSVYRIQGNPLVSIIIPNRDQSDSLKRAADSIFTKSTYRNFEILIVENGSTEEKTFAYYEELQKAHPNVRVVKWDRPFNYSAINNFGVTQSKGEYLLFLNNDVEVVTERWIEEMLGYCQRKDVGICGVRLYYPDGRLQHCGIVVGIGGIAGHICLYEKKNSGGYFGRVFKTQDVSAVTGACLMTSRKVFDEAGGFEEKLAVAYNDVDFCLKVRAKGLLVVYDAWAVLTHYESLSRGSDKAEADAAKHERQMNEAAILRERWPDIYRDGDPYFNPNLDYMTSGYILKGTIPPNYTNFDADGEKTEHDGQ
jgi:GT2 family glycosyltransferase